MKLTLVQKKIKTLLTISLALVGCIAIAAGFYQVSAGTTHPGAAADLLAQGVSNDYCLSCHSQPDMRRTLPSGEEVYLTIDADEYNHSVHGVNGYACVQCHTNIVTYPHPESTAMTRRDLTLEMNGTCASCHDWAFDPSQTGVHQLALANGNKEAAVCTDCHPAHTAQPLGEPRSTIPQTCQRCHSLIYEEYANSVHGEALIGEGNPDVPDCVDCHGSHFIQGPATGDFRLYSPQICEECHADKALMEKYGISTEVFETYVADFHGKSVVLFEPEYPGQETNKPVCIDCHSVHSIKSQDDPESSVMQDNLLRTCQKCHPDATANFPAAWMGHYIPSRENYPFVYFVDLFYKIFIPVVLGGMTVFVIADIVRKVINRRREGQHA
jgi:5-methylcytosine-specific restriction endonuclease McrA